MIFIFVKFTHIFVSDPTEVKFHYIGKGTIKLINFTLMLIGDTLASNSNPIKIFFKIYQIKMNILTS